MTTFQLPLHVEERGTTGRPLVLVHGFGANGYTWRHWIAELSRDHRVLIVELKGHGSAPKPPDHAYAPDDHAELLARMIAARGLVGATVIGHSLGGGIALLAALRLLQSRPAALDSLVLISAAALPQKLPLYVRWARNPLGSRFLFTFFRPERLVRTVLRSIVQDPSGITEGQVQAYAEPLRSPEGRRAILETARLILPPEAGREAELYPGMGLPTLLLWGREDPVVPLAQGQRLAGILPRARLEILEHCGHVPQEEKPRESLELVQAFLQEREEGRT